MSLIELSILRGIMEASEHKVYMSAPEYPLVMTAIFSMSTSDKQNEGLSVSVLNSCFLPSRLGKGIQSLLTNLLLTASSSSCGKLVAPMMRILSSLFVFAPSSSMRNSVFTLLEESCSPYFLEQRIESTQSMKITLGCLALATANRVLTNFSLYPTHLLVRELALMLKKVAEASLAMALPIIVFPVPGGPNRRIPLGGALSPVKISGRSIGQTIISWMTFLAKPSPAIYFHSIFCSLSTIQDSIICTSLASRFLNIGSISSSPSLFSFMAFCSSFSAFLKGGTNFFLMEVPFGSTLAETNSTFFFLLSSSFQFDFQALSCSFLCDM